MAGKYVFIDSASLQTSLADVTSASNGPSLVGFNGTLNYVAGTIGAVIGTPVNAKAYPWLCKGDGATDDYAALQAALTWAVQNNRELYLPHGIYVVNTGLAATGTSASNYGKSVRLTGEVSSVDGNVPATIIKWGGASSSANTLFTADGLAKLHVKGISFFGSSAVGNVFLTTYHAGSYSPFGWTFTDCSFENALSGGFGFRIIGTSGCARFKFDHCMFQAGANNVGFKSENANAVSTKFLACTFGVNQYGIHIAGGAFNADACEFSQNTSADVYLQNHDPITMISCWTEQSYQFVKSDRRQQYSPLTLINCKSSSYPWSYWKVNNEVPAQPTNDYTQWMTVLWDREGGLNIIGCNFTDVFNGASTGAIAPLTSSTITAGCQNSLNDRPTFVNIGSNSQSGTNTFTDKFMTYAGTTAANLVPTRKQVGSATVGGAVNIAAQYFSTAIYTLNANSTFTMPVSALNEPGDVCTLIILQDATGGRTLAFVNTKIVGGAFVPTAAANARSMIKLEYDGTFWNEISRGLALA